MQISQTNVRNFGFTCSECFLANALLFFLINMHKANDIQNKMLFFTWQSLNGLFIKYFFVSRNFVNKKAECVVFSIELVNPSVIYGAHRKRYAKNQFSSA